MDRNLLQSDSLWLVPIWRGRNCARGIDVMAIDQHLDADPVPFQDLPNEADIARWGNKSRRPDRARRCFYLQTWVAVYEVLRKRQHSAAWHHNREEFEPTCDCKRWIHRAWLHIWCWRCLRSAIQCSCSSGQYLELSLQWEFPCLPTLSLK